MKDIAMLIHSIGNNISDYVALVDSSLKIIWVNDNFKKAGLKKGKISKSSDIDVSLIKKAFKENKKQQRDNQKIIPVEFSGKNYVIVIKHMYASDSEKYKILTENTEDIIWTMNLRFKTTYVSQSVEKILGFTPEERKKQSLSEMVAPGSKKDILKLFRSEILKKKSKKNQILKIDIEYYKKDGSTIWMENIVKWLRDEKGNIKGIYGVARDISERKKYERYILEEKQKAENYLKISETIIVSLDKKGNILLLNDRGYDILGYKKGTLEGKNWFNTCIPKEQKEFMEQVFKNIVLGKIKQLEHYINPVVTKQGKQRIIEWYNSLIRDDKGSFVEVLSSGVDITEKIKFEEEQKKSKKMLQQVIDLLPSRIFWKDKKLRYLGCNTIFAKDAGKILPEELVGKTDFEMGWKDQAKLYQADDYKVIKSKRSKIDYIKPQTTPDGNTIWLRTSKVLLKDENNEIKGILGTYQNITKLKKAEDTLKKNEEKFRKYIENSPDGIFVADARGKYIEINKAACNMTGYSKEELLKMSIPDLIPKEHLKKSLDYFQTLLKTGRSSGENFFLTKKGEKRIWTVDAVKISENQMLGFCRDITDEKQIQENIRKSERLLQRVFEKLPIGLWFADKDGKLEKGNPKGKEIWGAEPKVGIEDYGVFKARNYVSGKQIKPKNWALYKTVKQGKTIENELLEIDGFDGKKRIIQNFTFPVFDDNKNVEKAIVVNIDVTELKEKEQGLKKIQEKLKEKYDLEKIISEISSRLINVKFQDADKEIKNLLSLISKKNNADRAYIFMFSKDNRFMSNTHEWCSQGVKPQIKNLQDIDVEKEARWFFKNIQEKKVLIVSDVKDLPKKASDFKKHLLQQDIKSLLITSIFYNGKIIGFIGLDKVKERCSWTESQISFIRSISNVFADFIIRIEVEKNLKQSEERFRKTIMDSPYPIMIHSEDGEVILVNNIWENITGYKHKEIPTISEWTKKAYGKEMSDVKKVIDDMYKAKTVSHEGEFEIRTKKGETRVWEFSSSPVGLTSDGKRQVMSIANDVTEKKRAQEELEQAKKNYMTVFENTGTATGTFGADSIITMCNTSFEKLVGYSHSEIEGKKHWYDFVSKEDIDRMQNYHEQRSRGKGKPPSEYDCTIFDKKGNKKQVHVKISIIPKTKTRIVSLIDLTKQKTYEEKLKQSEEKFRLLAKNSVDVIWTIDKNLRFTYLSDALYQMMGFRPKEWKNTHLSKHFTKKEFLRVGGLALKALKEYRTFKNIRFETKMLNKKQEEVPLEIASTLMFDKNGKPVGLQGITRDIRDRKKPEQELEESEKRYKFLIENSTEVMVILDKDAKIVFVNKFTLNLLKYKETKVLNHNISEFMPKESFEKASVSLKNDFEGKPGKRLEIELISSSGEKKIILTTEQGTLIKEQGKIKGILITGQDITGLRKAENKIKQNEQNLKEAQATAHLGSWEYDIKTKQFFGSDEAKRIYGFDIKKDDFSTEEVESCIPERKRVHQALIDLIEKNKEYDLVFEIHPKDNSEPKIISSKAKLIKDENNKPIKVSGIVQDITTKSRIENEKQKLNKELAQRVDELERFQRLTIGRELRMVELKKRLKELESNLEKR